MLTPFFGFKMLCWMICNVNILFYIKNIELNLENKFCL
ncbi:hypothetical protein PPHE_a1275 [Pseudoalteromonas phenolica O-BC30]|nr:hypothetical protein [Pseudoalteromonas phenolica O-BC30]